MTVYDAIWLILGLPLLGFLIQCFFGQSAIQALGAARGKKLMGGIAVSVIAGAFACGVAITHALATAPEEARVHIRTAFDWISIYSIRIPFELRIDTLSMTMVLIITGIGALIHLYATGYMAEEKDYTRFFAYLNLFVAFMLLLVLGNNLALLFIGWEGVGLCSYLLIGFWYKDLANSKAANKAFIVNRVGDVGLVLGMGLLVVLFATNKDQLGINDPRWLSYDVILPNIVGLLQNNPAMATAIALCLFVGACGKSAQFPLYLWLPDAMAGPTPVSALIHAATMVTAGVFLLNRLHPVFEMSPLASAIVVIIGLFTAIFAALIAFGQMDIKKVLAYSTVSQLGFMFIACGVGHYWAGMFHVITHAFFKALLFLGSGAVIHAMAHDQDMRNYGSLRKYIPITWFTMLIGYVSIAGFYWTAGFWSKEAILAGALGSQLAVFNGVNFGYWAGWIGFLAAFLTAVYMTRMMMLTFGGGQERWKLIPAHEHGHEHGHDHGHGHDDHGHHAEHGAHAHAHPHAHAHGPDKHGFFYTDAELAKAHSDEHDDHHHALDESHKPHEVPPSMWIPLAVLAVPSLFSGAWLYNFFGQKKHFLEHWLYPEGLAVLNEKVVPSYPKFISTDQLILISVIVATLGMGIGVLWYLRGLPKSEGWDLAKWNPIRLAASQQFGYDKTMVEAGVEGGNVVGNFFWRIIDSRLIDGLANGIGYFFGGLAKGFGVVQSGYARGYALMMLIGTAAILGWLFYSIGLFGGRS